MEVDGEEALALYRQARYSDDAGLFPDDLVRVYLAIAPKLGLPVERAKGEKLRDDARHWKAFPDSAAALARLREHYRLVAMTNTRRWAFDHFAKELGDPFHASFTADDTGTEKPDPGVLPEGRLPSWKVKAARRMTSCMSRRVSTMTSAYRAGSA